MTGSLNLAGLQFDEEHYCTIAELRDSKQEVKITIEATQEKLPFDGQDKQ